jgi:hypothetical protein
MRIAAMTLHGEADRPTLTLERIGAGLNVCHDPSGRAKVMLAELAGQTLFGKSAPRASEAADLPPGGTVQIVINKANATINVTGSIYNLRRRFSYYLVGCI